jgi:hypothetical protein
MDEDQNTSISNYSEFCENLNRLLLDEEFLDESKSSYELENVNTRAFLEAMRAWLEDTEGGDSFFDAPGKEHITWSDLHKLIQASAIYE